jgi:uncharacterized protein YukE
VADSRALLSGLEEYRKTLGTHLSNVNTEFQQLTSVWHGFAGVYEGDAAAQFKEGWDRITSRFQTYIDQTQRISRLLDERIDFLRDANQTEGGFNV